MYFGGLSGKADSAGYEKDGISLKAADNIMELEKLQNEGTGK